MRCALPLVLAALTVLAQPSPARAQGDRLNRLFEDSDGQAPALPEAPEALLAELVRRGQYPRALSLADALLAKQPGDLDLIARKLSILLITGRSDLAASLLEEAQAKTPKAEALFLAAGRIAERSGKLADARTAYAKAIEQNPDSDAGLEASLQLGWLLLDAGERIAAGKTWVRLLDAYDARENLSPAQLVTIGRACFGLDLCPEIKKRFRKPMYKYAKLMFDQALNQDPRSVEAMFSYGYSYRIKFNFPDARKALKRALKINPSHALARVELARTELNSYELGHQRFERARRNLQEALVSHPGCPEALALEAEMALSDGRYADAEKIAAEGLAANPAHIDLHAVSTALAVLKGDSPLIAKRKQALLSQRPSCARFLTQVAEIVGGRFRYAEARDLAKEALDLDPGYHLALAPYGLNLTRTGRNEEGIKALQRSQKHDPFNVYVWNTLKVFAKMKETYDTHKSAHFVLQLPKEEKASAAFILELLERAWETLGAKYGTRPKTVYVEFFSTIEDFSARSIGLPFIGALGVCFGNTMTVLSAKEKRLGKHSWGKTLWHEYTHVVTLSRTSNRVPRWLTEGISVYEESRGMKSWVRGYDRALITARRAGMILPISAFDSGFSRPRFQGQVMLSYYQGGMICEFVEETWGFGKIVELLDAFGAGSSQARAFESVFGFPQAEFDRRLLRWMDQHYAAYPASTLSPSPFAQMLQGVALNRERTELRRALYADPWNLRLRARMARVYSALGKEADAATLARDIRRKAGVLWELCARTLPRDTLLGRPAAGARASKQIRELRSALADADFVLGMGALKEHRIDAGVKLIKRAIKAGTSDSPAAHSVLAGIAFKANRYTEALGHYKAVARLVPPEAPIHRKLWRCYKRLKRPAAALDEKIRICLLDSSDLKSRVGVGKALYESKRWADLARVLDDVVYLDPFAGQSSFYCAEAMRHTGRHSRAVEAYEAAIRANFGERERCHMGQAISLEALGRLKDAALAAQKVLADDPAHTEAKAFLKRLEDKAR